MTKIEHHAS